MPRKYYDYYGDNVETNPYGEAVGRGLRSGIERTLERKQKSRDLDTQLRTAGLEPVQEGAEYEQTLDMGDMGKWGKKLTPLRKAEMEHKMREYQQPVQQPFNIMDLLKGDSGINPQEMEKSITVDSTGKASVRLTPKAPSLTETEATKSATFFAFSGSFFDMAMKQLYPFSTCRPFESTIFACFLYNLGVLPTGTQPSACSAVMVRVRSLPAANHIFGGTGF